MVDRYQSRHNIAPQQRQPVISNDAPDRIVEYRWGLVPAWMDEGNGFINARSETAAEKPAFRNAWSTRPCLVLSSGFYEWRQTNGGSKQPFRIYRSGERPLAMAGLWSPGAVDGPPTFTILTTEPNPLVESIHDRMPVILRSGKEHAWLEAGPDERHKFCAPYPDDDLEAYPIATSVNDPTNDDEQIIEPLQSEQSDLGKFGAD